MPIRDELRYLYDAEMTPEYAAVCRVVDARANGRCELCACPDGFRVTRHYGTAKPGKAGRSNRRVMYWKLRGYPDSPWMDHHGNEIGAQPPDLWEGEKEAHYHRYEESERLMHAHWNQDPEDNRPKNVRLVCNWCHNSHDGWPRALHAAETRKRKKDAQRPLIVVAIEGGN